jgi:hypothetical protein
VGLIVHDNEFGGRGTEHKPLSVIQREVMEFLREEAGFAQVFTINTNGYPVGRTMGAPIDDEWNVELIQRNVHHRIDQISRNPRMEVLWVGTPSGVSTNDRPHVYDFGLQAPRVVFLRGNGEFLDPDDTWERYWRRTERHLALGRTLSPVRDRADVDRNLIGVLVRPVRIRAEGFGSGAESYTWDVVAP